MAPLAGNLVGHYQILCQVGVGGMGMVFKAFDTTLQRTVATTNYSGTLPDRRVPMVALSYVTGTHNFKAGWQWASGQDVNDLQSIGDIEQMNYRNGVPESVVVTLGPYRTQEYVRADMGIYAQDSWTMRRLTLNLGVRLDYFNGVIEAQDDGAGTSRDEAQAAKAALLVNTLRTARLI